MNNSKNLHNFDIAIIGASFSGISLALAIASKNPNINIALIDKFDFLNQEKENDGKALAISSSSIEFFNSLNLKNELFTESAIIKDIKITNQDLFGNKINKKIENLGFSYCSKIGFLHFEKPSNQKFNGFGKIISSNILYDNLVKNIANFTNITAICPAEYSDIEFRDDVNIIHLNDKIINCKLLIACDGKKSKLRDIANIDYFYKDYQQIASIFKIRHSQDHQNIAWECFLPTGPLAILPSNNKNESAIVWINNQKQSNIVNHLDDENFISQLQKNISYRLGDITIASNKQHYQLTLSEATIFYHKRMALIGDSAVAINPIAGQGLNLAIKGIDILNQEINHHFSLHKNLDNLDFLTNFNQKFKKIAISMIMATDILNTIFESNNLIINKASNIGLSLIEKTKKIKEFFIKNAGS